jgi:cell wall-associated NlpC family hydrolase
VSARSTPSETQIQARLDAFMRQAAGPYRIGGAAVQVTPAFRMVGGMNQRSAATYVARIHAELSPEAYRTVAKDLGAVTAGKGSPEQVRRVTQAIIDSPAGTRYPATEAGVRQLMWDHGVGFDCSGYVHHAFLAARGATTSVVRGRYGLGDPLVSGLQSPSSQVFKRVDPGAVKAGDVMVLTNGDDGTGHKVIVYARHDVPTGTDMHARIAKALGSRTESQFSLIEVDSSWGAGGDAQRGGVDRRLFAYDADSGRWATMAKDDRGQWHAFASSKSGPYDHDLQGIYRPRGER